MSPLSLLLLLLTVVSTTSTIIEGMAIAMEEKTVRSFTVQELLSNQRSEEFAAILRTTKSLFFQPMRERSVECTAESVHKYYFAFTWKAIQASNVTLSKVGTTMNPRSK